MTARPLRVLVYPHAMSVGGSQLNAVELAGAVRDLGHDVVVTGQDGPLVDVVHRLGLPFVPCPAPGVRPSRRVVRALSALVAARDVDVLHGYEWPPALECYLAGRFLRRRPAVCTVMSMGVAPFLPDDMPLVVGTRRIQELVAPTRSGPVALLEPPVDTGLNAPGDEPDAARFGLDPAALHVVVVGRLAHELKLEGLLDAVGAVEELAREVPVQLLVVGGGPAEPVVAAAAARAGAAAGRPVVVLTGELADPRPAYALADVALGMGGSALRAMAFARPLVVQGERGFWEVLDPTTVDRFLHQGWYGTGSGGDGRARLVSLLRPLLRDAARRAELGAYGRRLVLERFSLDRAARVQEQLYADAVRPATCPRPAVRGSVRASVGLVRHESARRVRRLAGAAPSEDFNSLRGQAGPVRTGR